MRMNKTTTTLFIIGGLAVAAVFLWPILSGQRSFQLFNQQPDNIPTLGPHHWEVGKGVGYSDDG